MAERLSKKILVANRSEIAVRVMNGCRTLGIPSVAVYSEADKNSKHRWYADEAVFIGPPPPRESYLDIDKIIAADTREALTFACRALDRVIRAGRYWIPHWYKASHWIAYWDVFGRPPHKPRFFRGIPATWWYDSAKAAKLERAG